MSREIEQNPIKEQIPFDDSEREKIPSDKTPVIQTEKSSELSASDNNPSDVQITPAAVLIQTEKVLNFLPLTITHLTFK